MQATSHLGRPASGASRAEPSLAAWERLAQRARQHFGAGQLESALAVQVKALHVAQRLAASPLLAQQPDACMAAWVVSHHNLAQLLALRRQHALAIDYLCEAHLGLLALGDACSQPPGVCAAAWRHLRETRSALLQWQRQHGSQPRIDAALQASAHLSDSSRIAPPAPSRLAH